MFDVFYCWIMGVLGVAGFPAGNFCSFLRCYCRYIRLGHRNMYPDYCLTLNWLQFDLIGTVWLSC
ncbi:Uncharacterized protein APZ42_022023 [Daphnia magna]|uniref:Uncharacterized protein n=1 Tax=Daphnia magna TaxID=35525 RepID=A0A164VYW3_9CRUS|nr:Uncharacterized protein APZ42_022023 [Daphnia magna]